MPDIPLPGGGILTVGGPVHRISVNHKIHNFEMHSHSYCGPMRLNQNGEPSKTEPPDFLEAVSLWAQQGEQVDKDGLCIWHHEPVPITKKVGKRTHIVTGWNPPVKGE